MAPTSTPGPVKQANLMKTEKRLDAGISRAGGRGNAPDQATVARSAKRLGVVKKNQVKIQSKLSSCIIKKSQLRVGLEIELQMNK